jgi:hypothetical protein
MKRKIHHTAGAATFAVAAELSRRDYDVTLTIGNTPKVDLLCVSPSGKPFKVQVKGLSQDGDFFVQKAFFEDSGGDAPYLVVVRVSKIDEDSESRFRFFIISHQQTRDEFESYPKTKKDGTAYKHSDGGLAWNFVKSHEDKWSVLPGATEVTR